MLVHREPKRGIFQIEGHVQGSVMGLMCCLTIHCCHRCKDQTVVAAPLLCSPLALSPCFGIVRTVSDTDRMSLGNGKQVEAPLFPYSLRQKRWCSDHSLILQRTTAMPKTTPPPMFASDLTYYVGVWRRTPYDVTAWPQSLNANNGTAVCLQG